MDASFEQGRRDAAQESALTDFADVFAVYHHRILRYLDSLVRDPRLAEDLTQDTFLKAYQTLGRGVIPENWNAWLYAIATNTAMSALRRRRLLSWLPLPSAGPHEQADPARDLGEHSADRDLLLGVLASMPKLDAACLLLRFQQDLSYEEIARVLKVSVPAAKMRVHRARASFREIYLSLRPEASR